MKSFLQRLWVTLSVHVIGFYASTINCFEIKGSANIPRDGGALFASNHISAYETIFLPWAILRNLPMQMVWAPAKEELFEKPFQRMLYSSWGAFPVRRRRDMKASGIINNLLEDQKVMIFPEGTRHRDGKLGKGNRGVGKIIYDTRVTVVPVALTGLNRWEFPGAGQKASVTFGAPVDFSDLYHLPDCKETHNLIVERLMSAIATLLENEEAYVGEA